MFPHCQQLDLKQGHFLVRLKQTIIFPPRQIGAKTSSVGFMVKYFACLFFSVIISIFIVVRYAVKAIKQFELGFDSQRF